MSGIKLEIYIDGACKGNPGQSGVGVIICGENKEIIKNISKNIGHGTNNIAEYSALICALEEAQELKAKALNIKSDSQLLCRQINGSYKVRNENIISLYNKAINLIKTFEKVSVNHIPREENTGADKLANLGVKKQN